MVGNEVDLLIAFARQLKAFEIKAGATFPSHFTKGLSYFAQLAEDKALRGAIVYTGASERQTDSYDLLHFTNACESF